MKNAILILVLAILIVSSLALVYAAEIERQQQCNGACGDGDSGNSVTSGDDSENEQENQTQEQNKSQNKTKVEKGSLTFTPYQKRNESECLEGCKCVGAVVSCPTADGKIMTIEAGRSGNIITIIVNKTEVNTTLEIEIENETEAGKNKTKLKVKLSDGSKREIKIMPDTASETALERLRLRVCSSENNCTIELKEVPVGNNKTLAYEVQVQRHMRILALFQAKAQVRAEISAENGEIIVVKKPWWAFLALEPEE
jgi:hypothetical protein